MDAEKEIGEDVKNTVIARLRAIPDNALVSIRDDGTLTKDAMIREVEIDSELGKEIVEMHMSYLRSFKKGCPR